MRGSRTKQLKFLGALGGKADVWAVGERVHARLIDAGLPMTGLFAVPNSVRAIAPLVGRILLESEARHGMREVTELYLFYNCTGSGAVYAPVHRRLLPLDGDWRRKLVDLPWPTKSLPQVVGVGTPNAGRAHSRVSLRLALPGVRRIPRERKCEPPGRDGARRQEHRRASGAFRGSSIACGRAASTRSSSTSSRASKRCRNRRLGGDGCEARARLRIRHPHPSQAQCVYRRQNADSS